MDEQKKEMTQEREAAILDGAIKKFGYRHQVIVAVEELSELQKELTKWLRGSRCVHHAESAPTNLWRPDRSGNCQAGATGKAGAGR